MAHENITIQYPNFCRGPQAGTICTIDMSNVTTVLRVKNMSGGPGVDYTLTSNITGDLIGLEYIGPTNLSGMIDGLTFFTVEKIDSSHCLIKRWETQTMFSQLYLKEQILKYSTGNHYYDVVAFSVEYYNRSFIADNAGASGPLPAAQYLRMDDIDGLKLGTRLFLGPSSDVDNDGATEIVHVSHIALYGTEYRVYLTSPIQNQYRIGDSISLYTYLYLYSKIAYGGSTDMGTIYKFDAYSWNKKEADSKDIYKRVTASRWCPAIRGVASIINTNMLFIRPYDSYSNWRSLFLKNYESDNTTVYEVYDVIFDNYSIYKLQDKTTLRYDNGDKQTFTWSSYNYQTDTLLPYTDSINMWVDRSILLSYSQYELINIQVRDQYNVSLQDVNIDLHVVSGDMAALFTPPGGQGVTDINGRLTIGYTSGTEYEGHTVIKGKADKSFPATGSLDIWNSNAFISKLEYKKDKLMALIDKFEGVISSWLIPLWFEEERHWKRDAASLPPGKNLIDWFKPDVWLVQKSYFTSPGKDWVSSASGDAIEFGLLNQYLPELYNASTQADAPRKGISDNYPFSNWDNLSGSYDSPLGTICNQVRVVRDFVGEGSLRVLTYFWIYEYRWVMVEGVLEWLLVEVPTYVFITLPEETGHLQISQLKLSKHTHWLAEETGVNAYDYLWTYADINIFVFVEDAIPKFWSVKNSITTNIWLSLRPFMYSLDHTTFKMWIREVSYVGDTGYYEVTSQLTLTPFDAGPDLLGLKVLYNPIQDFHHNAVVFVRIEVYDIAPIPNQIETEYWFDVIPDYKAPYLTNLSPEREEDFVNVDTNVSFEIHDAGTGIAIDTLECFFNSIKISSGDLTIVEYSRYHYKVTYTPLVNLFYDKRYKMTVKVDDSSPAVNKMNDAWSFYTRSSDAVMFTDFYPIRCKRGASKFSSVSVLALADGDGIDKDSIKLQVFDQDVDSSKIPIVYRVS